MAWQLFLVVRRLCDGRTTRSFGNRRTGWPAEGLAVLPSPGFCSCRLDLLGSSPSSTLVFRARESCRSSAPAPSSVACFASTSDAGGTQTAPGSGSTATTPGEVEGGQDEDNGAAASASSRAGRSSAEPLPGGELEFERLGGLRLLQARVGMLFAWPWQRVKKGSILTVKLSGPIGEQLSGQFSRMPSLPKLTENLRKAAVDPRVAGLLLKIEPLDAGWGKVEEIRRHIELFKQSGKPLVAHMAIGGEKEYYLAASCGELYCPPAAYIALRGLKVQGQFLRGVLEKVGIDPQIQRIGKYKSAGDQLLRKDMSPENREMLTAILDDIYSNWVQGVAKARGKTAADVEALLDEGLFETEKLKEGGWINDIKYESEVEDMLKKRIGAKEDKPLRTVDYGRYSNVPEKTFYPAGGDLIAVVRAVGAIGRGKRRVGTGISSETFIERIRFVRENRKFKAVVLRIDSPGGDALASDLMWHELRLLAAAKPVIASMVDVAASGGYYMAMGSQCIVAEALTLTGSIGVVTGKFNLQPLYERIGFKKEFIARGRFAEVDADNRPFTEEEEAYFARQAMSAYKSFRDKAALSRHMAVDEMEELAQGRVWTGAAAEAKGLVDALGGFQRAVAIAKQKAGIALDKKVRLVELSRQQPSLGMLLSQGASAMAFFALSGSPEGRMEMIRSLLAEAMPADMPAVSRGDPQARMEDVSFGDSAGSRDLWSSVVASWLATAYSKPNY
eukprot:SM000008S22293  [mRNA]  locus=s8:892665:896645:+ [translate_table: standard]